MITNLSLRDLLRLCRREISRNVLPTFVNLSGISFQLPLLAVTTNRTILELIEEEFEINTQNQCKKFKPSRTKRNIFIRNCS